MAVHRYKHCGVKWPCWEEGAWKTIKGFISSETKNLGLKDFSKFNTNKQNIDLFVYSCPKANQVTSFEGNKLFWLEAETGKLRPVPNQAGWDGRLLELREHQIWAQAVLLSFADLFYLEDICVWMFFCWRRTWKYWVVLQRSLPVGFMYLSFFRLPLAGFRCTD